MGHRAETTTSVMLRKRLFLNLLPFIVVLVSISIYAIILYLRLALHVDETVTKNYECQTAADTMGAALSGMDRFISLSAIAGEKTTDSVSFQTEKRRFDEGVPILLSDSQSDQLVLSHKVSETYDTFLLTINKMGSNSVPVDRREIYEKEIVPRVLLIQSLLEKIRDLSHADILATSENIRGLTRNVIRLMIIGMSIGLLISLYACYSIGRSILQPIRLLTEATRELGEGNLRQPLPITTKDEFGELARAFNKMAAQLSEYRQSTTEKIVQLHRTMETTLASFPDPIFVLNKKGEVELKNPAADNLLQNQQSGNEWSRRLHAIAQKTFSTGENFLPHDFAEGITYRANGVEKFFLPRALAMRDPDNALIGVAVVLYDVTRFRLMDAAKTNLVATVSHELKTPLTSVRMAHYMLLEKNFGPLTAKQEQLLETARDDADRLLRMLNDLLDLARLEEGNAELRKEKVSPAALLEDVAHEMTDQIAAKGLVLQSSIAPGLPTVFVDRQRIKYVFANLLTNAVKFSPPGGKIVFSAAPGDDGEVLFSVADEGPGIRDEYHVRVFDRFFRVPGGDKPGAGLGLSIAKEITLAHGGRIGVRNGPEGGSVFYVSLKGDAKAG